MTANIQSISTTTMNKLSIFIFVLFLSVGIYAQDNAAALLVRETEYEYLLEDTMFVKSAAEYFNGKADEEIPELTDNDRIRCIYEVQLAVIYNTCGSLFEDENANKEVLRAYVTEAKQTIKTLDAEAKKLLTKKNYRKFKQTKLMANYALAVTKFISRMMKE